MITEIYVYKMMIQFTTTIQKFGEQGEKTGWTYIKIPAAYAQKLMPGNKKSFRVKGTLDDYPIESIALLPMGEGDFIMAINTTMRKGLLKRKGDTLNVQIEVDHKPILPSADLVECLQDEPKALAKFNKLPKSHQNYYTKWIESAKTETTKAKRIAQAVTALSRDMDFGEALRAIKQEKQDLLS